MHYVYLANDSGLILYLADGSVVNKCINQGMDIYRERVHEDVRVRELVYSQKTKKFLTEVVVYYGETEKVVADPEHGWIGV